MSSTDPVRRVVTTNKKARYMYHVLDELETGISLVGTEVKALRAGQCSIQEAYVRIKGGEMWLVGANIPEYAFGNRQNHLPTRDRKLLAHRREIQKWFKQVRESRATAITSVRWSWLIFGPSTGSRRKRFSARCWR